MTNSASTRRRAWLRSLCAISTETSLPFSDGDDVGEALRERRRDALERLVEQQQARADGERARQRDELLLAAREQQRAPVAHLDELGQDAVDEGEPLLGHERRG